MRGRPALPSKLRRLGLCGAALCALSCLRDARGPSAALPGAAAQSASHVELREVEHHPPINLLFRLGDPAPAIAFALSHDDGSQASVELAALLTARLRAAGVRNLLSAPSQLGLELAVLATEPADARNFVRAVTSALATPIGEGDACLAEVSAQLEALRRRPFAGAGEQALASCSGELGAAVGGARAPSGDALRAELERLRQQAFAAQRSAFAAVGPSAFLELCARELADTPGWPSGQATNDAWPASDAMFGDFADGPARLSVALRAADAGRAVLAAHALSARSGALSARVRAFLPGFRLERAVATARPRGACLRVDLGATGAPNGLDADELALASDLVADEMNAALRGALANADTLDESATRPADPRDSAAAAAWRALVGRLEPGPVRRALAWTLPRSEAGKPGELAAALDRLEKRRGAGTIELRSRVESGQGELWLLLGNRCGTGNEARDDAGHGALALTLAARDRASDVELEPWLTSDGLGLLAHAPRRGGESADAHAERVAGALALALLGGVRAADQPLYARSELAAQSFGRPRPGFARLLEALAPEHPSWLEPRGTFETLADASPSSLASHTRELLRGPLRLAVLANRDDKQAALAERTLERWLLPLRLEARACGTSAPPSTPPRLSELSVETSDDGQLESAYVGVPLEARVVRGRAALATVAQLNRRGALLDAAFAESGISASAGAELLGGSRGGALVVTVRASDDEARKAVTSVRQVLDRLARGASGADDVTRAESEQRERDLSGELSPRRRIVDLWRGAPDEPPLSLPALRSFQSALASASHSVVYVTHRR